MGESLYRRFLKDRIVNLLEFVLLNGIEGLLSEFENWLRENGNLIKE